jgi:hypothetical protein
VQDIFYDGIDVTTDMQKQPCLLLPRKFQNLIVGWFDEPTADRRRDQGAGKAGFPFSAKGTSAQYSHIRKNNFRIFRTWGYFKMWSCSLGSNLATAPKGWYWAESNEEPAWQSVLFHYLPSSFPFITLYIVKILF